MSDVKPYTADGKRRYTLERAYDAVLYRDYDALRRERDGLRESLERIHRVADEGSMDPVQFRVLIRAECRKALKASGGGEVGG